MTVYFTYGDRRIEQHPGQGFIDQPVDPKANDHYGAFQVGQRDELVTALGLATQLDERGGNTLLHLMEGWGPVSEWHPNARPRRLQRSR